MTTQATRPTQPPATSVNAVESAERKDFMRRVYAGYWLGARERIYGFLAYDRWLCDYLGAQLGPPAPATPRVLEVAVGTGYPIADFLARSGYRVHGVDIAPDLVERCRQLNPEIDAVVGDAEQLNHPDGAFDATFCFHSSWYFPDLGRALAEMIRVTRKGGLVMFDIQNAANPAIAAAYQRRLDQLRPGLRSRATLHARNLAKVVLRRGNPNWRAVNFEVPSDPAAVLSHLRRLGHTDLALFGREDSDQKEPFAESGTGSTSSVRPLHPNGPLDRDPRLVFAIRT